MVYLAALIVTLTAASTAVALPAAGASKHFHLKTAVTKGPAKFNNLFGELLTSLSS